MADLIQCATCGAPDQEVGKYCEQCGAKVEASPAAGAPDPADAAIAPTGSAPGEADDGSEQGSPALTGAVTSNGASEGSPATMRFVRLENGVYNQDHSFEVPVGAQLLVGRTDPSNGVFPEVDVTMWSQRVQTPEGALYTVHRKQCIINRDDDGRVWLRDYPDYLGDTLVSPAGTTQFHTIPSLSGDRESNSEGAIALEPGDRILMGQGEGMLIFQLVAGA